MVIDLPTASEVLTLCYTRAAWADTWDEQPLLECLSIQSNAAPSHSSATFRFRYGGLMMPEIGSRAEDATPTTEARPDLIGYYVKVVITGIAEWYGVIPDSADNRQGVLATVPTGEQHYNAFGLTWFLEQCKPITQTVHKTGTGTSQTINRAMPFNGGTDGKNRKNRVVWKNYDSTEKCFTDRFKTTAPLAWKASNAIEYLLAEFPPKDSTGTVLITFELDTDALTFLDYEIPRIECHGRTLWDLFNQIISRQRGLGWHAWVDTGDDSIKLKVWSQNAADITLPGGSTVPENPDTVTYNFDTYKNILDATIATTLLTHYDQVIVEGERAGSVFSVRMNSNMEEGWTTTERDAYDDAATAQTGFGSLTDEEKLAANNEYRTQDYLSRVMSYFKLPSEWDGRSDTEPTSGSAPFAFPELDEDGVDDIATSAKFYRHGLRFEPFIPLLPGIDYTTGVDSDTNVSDVHGGDFIPPIVVFQCDPVNTGHTADEGWIHAERLNEAYESGATMRPFKYSVDVAVQEDQPGLILRTVGAPQHYIGTDWWTSQGTYEDIPAGEGLSSEDWIATVYVLQDDFCRGVYPLKASLPTLDLVRQLRLKCPGAHLDYLADGTIVGVSGGELKLNGDGGVWIRDDRQKCNDIARLAFEWYGTTRRTLNLSFRGIAAIAGFDLGVLVTDIGTGATLETINTVITSISYDLVAGTTRISTQFGEIDFVASVGNL